MFFIVIDFRRLHLLVKVDARTDKSVYPAPESCVVPLRRSFYLCNNIDVDPKVKHGSTAILLPLFMHQAQVLGTGVIVDN